MLNALVSYNFDDSPVRVVMVGEGPWFVASDVAGVLGYRDGPTMTRNLDDDEKGTHIVCTLKGDQSLTIINESGLYNAIFKSRREEAQRFRRWVTGEVLPALRRHGRYELPGLPEPPALVSEDIDPVKLTAAIGVIKEARLVWGPVPTREIWIKLGLPSPIADAAATHEADDMVALLREATKGMSEASGEQLLDALVVPPAQRTMSTRRRVGEAIRLLGWRATVRRIDGRPTKLWAAPTRAGEDA